MNTPSPVPTYPTQTALEIARSLVVGYIEEEDDMDDETDASEPEDTGDGGGGGDIDASQRRRKTSLSGSDSDGSADRRIAMMQWGHRSSATTPRASTSSRATTPRAFTPSRAARTQRELISRLGYPAPAPFSGGNDDITRHEIGASTRGRKPAAGGGGDGGSGGGGGSNSNDDSRPGRLKSTGSGSDSSDNARRKTLDPRRLSAGGPPAVGIGVKLSAQAAAILNSDSPTPKEDDDPAGRGRSRSTPGGVEDRRRAPSVPPNPRQIITRHATTPEAPVSTVPLNPRQTITRNSTAPDAPLPTTGDGGPGSGRRLMPCSTSLSADRPLTLDRPVTPRWMEVCVYVV